MLENQPFECTLRAQPHYRTGERITIVFEILNSSDETYRILPGDTPLQDQPLDFLSVNHEGSEVRYDGPLVSRSDASEEDYISLASGEARSGEVDISKLYAIQLPGEYTVTLDTALHDAYSASREAAATPRVHQPRDLERVSVTFTVEAGDPPRMTLGQAARMAELANEPPGRLAREIFQPWLTGGTPAQQAEVRTAHAHAVFKVGQAVDQLAIGGYSSLLYRTWFGNNVKIDPIFAPIMTFDIVRNDFAVIRSIMNFPTFPVQTYVLSGGPLCQPNFNAYTFDNSRLVYLCQSFWGRPLYTAPNSKFGILIHEWSHAAAHTVDDAAMSVDACRILANTKPVRAAFNAYSHQYFAEFL
ncbi:M35 family metallopeptidase [Kitasatospora sp. NPDC048239]|uniref:M35 family metallopeptidase n=1 Tax=Kitasatospora sp. NPDC048239 TaxID=3364046 RepID=UPI0037151352